MLNVILILKMLFTVDAREIISAFYDIKRSGAFLCFSVFHFVQMKLSNFVESLLGGRPGTLSRESGIVDLLFLGLCLRKN